jgi:phage tail sheath protein FI
MPPNDMAAGVRVHEIPPSARRITGIATSITAFVGRTRKGPRNAPSLVTSMNDFERVYGGLSADCPLSYAVRHFFENGGAQAIIARVCHRIGAGFVDETASIIDTDLVAPSLEATQGGLWLLDKVDAVDLLCLPPLAPGVDVAPATWNAAIRYAATRRAFVIVDAPAAWTTTAEAAAEVARFVDRDSHGALYFPRMLAPDPLAAHQPRPFAPGGAIAGLYARTNRNRGIWQAPSGRQATLNGATGLTASLSDADNRVLDSLGVNCLRSFPGTGPVAWGARTLAGSDGFASEWKYVALRRLALFIEESLYQGLKWTVFEPNGEPLWAAIRASVGAFLHELFRQEAFQGSTPKEAYFVSCDAQTTTHLDVASGIANLEIGFAASQPGEFVVLRLALQAAAPLD